MKSKIFMMLALLFLAKNVQAKVNEKDIVQHIYNKVQVKDNIPNDQDKKFYGIITYDSNKKKLEDFFKTSLLASPNVKYPKLYNTLEEVTALKNHPQIQSFNQKGLTTSIYEMCLLRGEFTKAYDLDGKEIANLMGEKAFRKGNFRNKLKTLDDVYDLLKQEKFVDLDFFNEVTEHVMDKVPIIQQKLTSIQEGVLKKTEYQFEIFKNFNKNLSLYLKNKNLDLNMNFESLGDSFKPDVLTVVGKINNIYVSLEIVKDVYFDLMLYKNNSIQLTPPEVKDLYIKCTDICYNLIEKINVNEKIKQGLTGKNSIEQMNPLIKRDLKTPRFLNREFLKFNDYPENGFEYYKESKNSKLQPSGVLEKTKKIDFKIIGDNIEGVRYRLFLTYDTKKSQEGVDTSSSVSLEIIDQAGNNSIDHILCKGKIYEKQVNSSMTFREGLGIYLMMNNQPNLHRLTRDEAEKIYNHCRKEYTKLMKNPEFQAQLMNHTNRRANLIKALE